MNLPWQVKVGTVAGLCLAFAAWLHVHDAGVRADALAGPQRAQQVMVRDTARDTIHVVEKRIVVDTQRVVIRKLAADSAVAKFDSAAHALQSVADTSHSGTVPLSVAMPPVTACHEALAKKDALVAAKDAELFDVGIDRDSWKKYALAGDSVAKLTPHPSRVGFKTGVVVGIAAAAAFVHYVAKK